MAKTYYMREGEQPRPAPYSLRLTPEERTELEKRAGTMPLASYIKSVLFAADAPRYRRRRKGPVQDQKALADVLACLGASRVASNLNQLAKAANFGSLYFDEEAKRALVRACDDVQAMRGLLMAALGLKQADESAPASPSLNFTLAAHPKRA